VTIVRSAQCTLRQFAPTIFDHTDIRMLLIGIVPQNCKLINKWSDDHEAIMYFHLGKGFDSIIVRVFPLKHSDIYFDEEIVSFPVQLWLKKK
jgi:hypothetical protein